MTRDQQARTAKPMSNESGSWNRDANSLSLEPMITPIMILRSFGGYPSFLMMILIIFGLPLALVIPVHGEWLAIPITFVFMSFLIFGPSLHGIWAVFRAFPLIRVITAQSWREQLCLADVPPEPYLMEKLGRPMRLRLQGCLEWGILGFCFVCVFPLLGLAFGGIRDGLRFLTLPVVYGPYVYCAEAVGRWGVAELLIRGSATLPGKKPEEARAVFIAELVLLGAALGIPYSLLDFMETQGRVVRLLLVAGFLCGSIALARWLRGRARRRWVEAMSAFYTFD